MISYYISGCSPDNVTYSIDKLILDFKLRMRSGEEFASGFLLFYPWTWTWSLKAGRSGRLEPFGSSSAFSAPMEVVFGSVSA